MKKFKRVANIRDLGGIPVADGRSVIAGRLIRGGHLNKIDIEEAKEFCKALKISNVVDLRSPSELDEKPDKIPEDIKYSHIPSLTNEQNPAISRKNRTSELKRIMKLEGGAVGHLSRLYRTMITQEMSKESHRKLLLTLIENEDGAVYWHCTQGKDRTGVAAAVILMTLGASKDEIIKDYLNESSGLKFKNSVLTSLVGVVLFNMKAKKNLSALMNAKVACMEAALDEIDKLYGSMENYIVEGLGITREQINIIRDKYLK